MLKLMSDIFSGFVMAIATVILAAAIFVGYFVVCKNGELKSVAMTNDGYVNIMSKEGYNDAVWLVEQKLRDREGYWLNIGNTRYYVTYDK